MRRHSRTALALATPHKPHFPWCSQKPWDCRLLRVVSGAGLQADQWVLPPLSLECRSPSCAGEALGWEVGVRHLPMSVSGPQELVTQVLAVLLEYLKSPDSSPTVQAWGAGKVGRGRQVELGETPSSPHWSQSEL